jgi:acyl-CoA thioesterase-1
VPGETTDRGLQRLPAVLTRFRPALVILCHGGNDILRNRPAQELERNLSRLIDVIRAHGAQAVMLGVPGRNLTLSAPAAYANVAASQGVPIDAETLPALMRDARMKSDRVHFNAAGYAQMAQAAYDLLAQTGAL